MLLKNSGENIRKIRDQSEQEIMNVFQCEVRLTLVAANKVKC